MATKYLAELGLPQTAAACVASLSTSVGAAPGEVDGLGAALYVRTAEMDLDPADTLPYRVPRIILRRLRWLLVLADEQTYAQTIELLEPFREGLLCQRILTSFLFPERREWVAADFAALSRDYRGPSDLLVFSALDPAQIRDWWVDGLGPLVSAWDAFGPDAVPLLLRWLDRSFINRSFRLHSLDVLSRIPTDAAFDGLLTRIELADVPAAVDAAAARFPERAARLLAARRDDVVINLLLAKHLKANPELGEPTSGGPKSPVEAAAGDVPLLLSDPPWSRTPGERKQRLTEQSLAPVEPTIEWLDGEQRQWMPTWPLEQDGPAWAKHLTQRGADPAFFAYGPRELVRPKLADWDAGTASFYLEEPWAIAAKYELDALPALLRLATRKPSVGGPLLLLYRSIEVARLMTRWSTRSRQLRPLAQKWFDRHGKAAVSLVLRDALVGTPPQHRAAVLAVSRLDPDLVREAGVDLGYPDEVSAILSTDPLLLAPTRVPAIPTWLDTELLPPVMLANQASALPSTAITTLCRMAMMSDLTDPYPGLRIIAGDCDPASLADFAWALYGSWTLAGRPSNGAWAMNALAFLGNDTVADRLTSYIMTWPAQGATARAKRGVDVLAAMDTDHALATIGTIARTAKTTSIRAHAANQLDRAAVDRGLLPDQLDDLLAPDLGLNDPPLRYQGGSYTIELDHHLDLVLKDPVAATPITVLPKPRDASDRSVVKTWNQQRKLARSAIKDQTRRFEEAMIVQRPWTGTEFASAIAGHPLLGRIARCLIWHTDNGAAAIDPLGDLVDIHGHLMPPTQQVRLAHPATSDLIGWRSWLTRHQIVQPFAQIDRDTYDGDPSQHWARTVEAATLYRLIDHGWRWGPTGRAATRDRILRQFPGQGTVVLQFSPGLSAVQSAANQPVQTIDSLTFESLERPDLAVFSDLPKVTRSELLRDLHHLH